jgi:hypothetical protein
VSRVAVSGGGRARLSVSHVGRGWLALVVRVVVIMVAEKGGRGVRHAQQQCVPQQQRRGKPAIQSTHQRLHGANCTFSSGQWTL